ncbi:hypothetical protein [uncultured Clostridium sp.]
MEELIKGIIEHGEKYGREGFVNYAIGWIKADVKKWSKKLQNV